MNISGLWIYPVKSLGGVPVTAADVEARGLAGDRRWMIVDGNGRFVTRREVPELARIGMESGEGGHRVSAREGEAMLPVRTSQGLRMPVTVWSDTIDALVVENEASVLISEVAGRALRLAYLPDDTHRSVSAFYGRPAEEVSFADGFPILVASEASLAAVNAELATPVPMARFRPNIVLAGEGLKPWSEAKWAEILTGEVRMRFAKPCSRCIVITQHPDTGARAEGNAVPMALRRLGRFNAEGVLFGMNAVAETWGTIAVGDEVAFRPSP